MQDRPAKDGAAISGRQPDNEVYAFVNDFERPIGAYQYLCGRRMYGATVCWETLSIGGDQSATSRRSGEWPK